MTTLGLHRAEGFATADAVCPQCRRFIRVIKAEKDVECRPGCVQPLTLLQRRRPPNPRCASRPKMLANPRTACGERPPWRKHGPQYVTHILSTSPQLSTGARVARCGAVSGVESLKATV